jgi:hypothetical protein
MTPMHFKSEKDNPLDVLKGGERVLFRVEKHQKLNGVEISVYIPYAPMWIKVAFNDPSLSVRAEAIWGINTLFKGGYGVPNNVFDLLDTYFLKQWWTKNSSNQAGIALIAFAGGGSPMQQVDARLDQIGLYDEAQRLAKTSAWGAELE